MARGPIEATLLQVLEHGRRRILHFNTAPHPAAEWVVQQLREAFPDAGPYRYAILDHDSIFEREVIGFLKATGLKVKQTSVQAPWQNGTAEMDQELPPRDTRSRDRPE
jgi:hypothetical protein